MSAYQYKKISENSTVITSHALCGRSTHLCLVISLSLYLVLVITVTLSLSLSLFVDCLVLSVRLVTVCPSDSAAPSFASFPLPFLFLSSSFPRPFLFLSSSVPLPFRFRSASLPFSCPFHYVISF